MPTPDRLSVRDFAGAQTRSARAGGRLRPVDISDHRDDQIGWIWPDSLNIARQYHVTELIPMPSLQPEPLKVKPPAACPSQTSAEAPVFQTPKLTVPREIRRPEAAGLEEAAAKDRGQQFHAHRVEAGDWRSSPVPDRPYGGIWQHSHSNSQCSDEKVQTGGFGDPNGVQGQGKQNAHLVVANSGAFDLPPGRWHWQRLRRDKGHKGNDCERRLWQWNRAGRSG